MSDLSKITAILKAMKISDETVSEFNAVLENWVADTRKTLNEDYTNKLQQAKKVCLEEVEAYKANLARGVKVFLESKMGSLEKAAAKRKAIEESEAVNTLKHVKSLLEGVDIDGKKANQDLQAARKEVAAVKKQLAESRDAIAREKAKVSRLTGISEKSIERQKILEGKLAAKDKEIMESRKPKPVDKRRTLAESKPKKTKPQTKKTVIAESKQNHRAAKPVDDIDQIAASIE
jgi:hypothetical protein